MFLFEWSVACAAGYRYYMGHDMGHEIWHALWLLVMISAPDEPLA